MSLDRLVYFNQLIGGVQISRPDFIDEHLNLLNILRRGSKSARRREAKDQARELANVLSGAGTCGSRHSVAPEPDQTFEDDIVEMFVEAIGDQDNHPLAYTRRELEAISTYALGRGMSEDALDACLARAYRILRDDPSDVVNTGGGTCESRPATVSPDDLQSIKQEIKCRFKELLDDPEYHTQRNEHTKRQYWKYHSQSIYDLGLVRGLKVKQIDKLLEDAKREMDPGDIEGGRKRK